MLALPTWLATAYWLPAAGLMAYAQGLLMPAIRRTPPGAEAKRQAFALHILLGIVYALPLLLLTQLGLPGKVVATHAVLMALARLLLFDPLLNLGAGDKLFAVGQTAASDRALQKLAQRLGWPAERVRAVLWVVCLVGACLLIILNS